MNILFTSAGRRNYLLNYFKEIMGDEVVIIAVDSQASAPALADADLSFTVPSISDTSYIVKLKEIIDDYQVDAVIPLNDLELPLLAKHKTFLEAGGAKIIVANENIISICSDKWKTFRFFQKLGIPTPLTFLSLEDTLNALSANILHFPLVLKPRWGSGSLNVEIVNDEKELGLAYEWLKTRLKTSSLNYLNLSNSHNTILIQEKIEGQEYGMDILNDFQGKHYDSFVRKKLSMRSGETDRAITVKNKAFSHMGQILAEATKHIGMMDCDFFLVGEKIYFLEMNPRFGGGYPLSHEGGINVPQIYIEWLKGGNDIDRFNNYVGDRTFSKCSRIVEVPKPIFDQNSTKLSFQ